jgi:putative oxidoreductase
VTHSSPPRAFDVLNQAIRRWAPIPLRAIVGFGLMAHGYAKLVKGPMAFAGILHGLGVPAPELLAWATIATELGGGVAVLVGAFIPLVSVPLSAILAVAAITTHLPYGFSSIKLQAVVDGRAQFGPPGYETDLLYLACLAALVMGGSGPLAVNTLFSTRRTSRHF